jgi:hypothetical protein
MFTINYLHLYLTNNISASANSVFVHDKWFLSLTKAALDNKISLKTATALCDNEEQGWRYENAEFPLIKRKNTLRYQSG